MTLYCSRLTGASSLDRLWLIVQRLDLFKKWWGHNAGLIAISVKSKEAKGIVRASDDSQRV